MATKNEQECTMTAAVADIRRQTKSLVQRAEIRRQSKMLAYDEIGSQIGTSGMWVHGFVKGYDRYRLNHIVALNIQALYQKYEAVCSVIEANTETMLRDESYAAPKSHSREYPSQDTPTSQFLPPLEL